MIWNHDILAIDYRDKVQRIFRFDSRQTTRRFPVVTAVSLSQPQDRDLLTRTAVSREVLVGVVGNWNRETRGEEDLCIFDEKAAVIIPLLSSHPALLLDIITQVKG